MVEQLFACPASEAQLGELAAVALLEQLELVPTGQAAARHREGRGEAHATGKARPPIEGAGS